MRKVRLRIFILAKKLQLWPLSDLKQRAISKFRVSNKRWKGNFGAQNRKGKGKIAQQRQKLSVQFSSVAQSCPTLCNSMYCSRPGFPIHQQLPKLAQTHVHQVSDVIQPSHTLSSPSPPVFNLSLHQSFPVSQFFTSDGQSIGASASASVFPMAKHTHDWKHNQELGK